MSANTTKTDVEQKDVTADNAEQPLTREARKAERDAAFRAANENNPNKAPKNLFASNPSVAAAKEDPEAVTVFKKHIDAYVQASGKGKGDGKSVEIATIGLQVAIRNMLKMSGASLTESFKYLYMAGRGETTAFLMPYPMRFANKIQGESERLAYASFMNLMCRYMRLSNPTTIHNVVDVNLSLSFIKNKDQLAAVVKLFAK